MSRSGDVEQGKCASSGSSDGGIAFPRSTSPAGDSSPTTRHARERTSSSRRRSLQAPVLDAHSTAGAGAQSPLARLGIKGDALMLFVTCFASLGVLLFGYDQGVMSGIITGPYFKSYFGHPTSYQIGTMVAILEVGAFITSLACGTLADILGRKKLLFVGALVFSTGGAIQTFTTGFGSMVLGRVIAGFGVGVLSMIVPTYQSEISPAENRGRLACIEFTGNIVGYCLSVWVDYFCSFLSGDISWRLPLSLQVIVGLILAFGSLLLPESPRWLLDHDRDEEGMRVLADLHGSGDPTAERAKLEFREIKENVLFMREQGERSYRAMWKRYRYRTLIACSSQAGAQLNGINILSYYAPILFESAGWVGRDAILMSGINAIIYVLSTIPTWFLIDRLGRRLILMSGAIVCALAFYACGFFLWKDAVYTPSAVVGCVIVYNAFFGYSWGPVPWMYPAEIMPLAFRAKGTSLATATNWAFNYIVGEGTPVLQDLIKWRLYPMHGTFCIGSFFLVYYCYPETMGVPLEEIDSLFNDKPSSVPQDDSDSEDEASTRTRRPLRRSISSHPRFEDETLRAARQAAAAHERELRRQQRGGIVPGFVKRLFGVANERPQGGGEYAPVRGDEH